MKKNITIIGTGAYGTVLANVLADNGNEVLMYGIDMFQIEDINKNNLNSVFFNDILINEKIKATNDIKEAFEKPEIIVICVPTFAINSTLELIINNLKNNVHIITTTKGLDGDNLDFLSNKIADFFKNNKHILSIGGLYGPSIAKECVLRKPTCVMVANKDLDSAKMIAKLFRNDYFFTEPTTDLIGCEISAALKNTVAIACGILDGFNYGDNAHASLITIGNKEIFNFAQKFGAKAETFLNFATIGDLVLTASSRGSRNFSLGIDIAHADDASKVLKTHKVTVEGVLTCDILIKIAKKYNISMPLFELVHKILYNNSKPSLLIQNIFRQSMANNK